MTQPVAEPTDSRTVSGLEYRTRQLARRPALTPVGGLGVFEIKVFFDHEVVTEYDWKFDIPVELDESVLVDVEAWVTTVSSSGTIQVQIRNETQSQDMLSTVASIDVGELNDDDSATPFVIDTANDEVAYKDEIWVRVVNPGTGAQGLGVKLSFAPAANAAIVLQGAQGPPGGMTSFEGAWQDTTGYTAGDIVSHGGTLYIALQDHTSNAANDEPGVGTNWEDFWVPVVNIPFEAGASFTVVSSSGAIPTGIKAAVVVPSAATIRKAIILADVAGDAVVDIWKVNYAGYPATVADSITAATPPTLTSQIKNVDTTLSGWDTSLALEDILVFHVSGVVSITRLTLYLGLEK